MKPKKKVVICEVIEARRVGVHLRVRISRERIAEFWLPRILCPSCACLAGGAFYLETYAVNAREEKKRLAELFGDESDAR